MPNKQYTVFDKKYVNRWVTVDTDVVIKFEEQRAVVDEKYVDQFTGNPEYIIEELGKTETPVEEPVINTPQPEESKAAVTVEPVEEEKPLDEAQEITDNTDEDIISKILGK